MRGLMFQTRAFLVARLWPQRYNGRMKRNSSTGRCCEQVRCGGYTGKGLE